MMDLPKVIIGGYPRSGTSFLCNFVARMGFWPGFYYNLKGVNKYNKMGYWEYISIQKIARGAAQFHVDGGIIYTKPDTIPLVPLNLRNDPAVEKIRDIALNDDVEIYKDNALPILYELFPRDSKYIIIRRDREDVYQSVLKFQRAPWSLETIHDGAFWGIPRTNVYKAIDIYAELERTMMKNVSCLVVKYEDFGNCLDLQAQRIAEFLGLDRTMLNMRLLRSTYRPRGRKGSESKD